LSKRIIEIEINSELGNRLYRLLQTMIEEYPAVLKEIKED